MLQPPKDKKKKANGSSSYGQISSSQEQRAQKTNTAAKNFLSKAGKVAVDIAVESSGLGLGKRVLGAVKNMASSGRTSNQESAKEAVLGASPSIRSKGKAPSKVPSKPSPSQRPSQHPRPKTKTKSSQPSRPDGVPMMGKPKEGISMRIKNRLGLGQ